VKALREIFGFPNPVNEKAARVFALLMRMGLVPERVCEECADIWSRRAAA
jgi:hypothetical protein